MKVVIEWKNLMRACSAVPAFPCVKGYTNKECKPENCPLLADEPPKQED